MAIYHCSIQMIGRSAGRSAIAAAAYRSASILDDEETGLHHNYTRKSEVVHSEILLCENAPAEYADRQTLWNAVQKVETNKNAQLAREVQVALPKELSRDQQIEVVRNYVKDNFVNQGMCADFSIHDKGDGNPHSHIMLTTRSISKDGKWAAKEKKGYALDSKGEKIPIIDPATNQQKIGARGRKMWKRETVQVNDWNDRGKAEEWRKAWAEECNHHLAPELQIDHRSLKRQGIERIPTVHEGYAAREMEKRGIESDLCKKNRQIAEYNKELTQIDGVLKQLAQELTHIKELALQKGAELNDRIGKFLKRRSDFKSARSARGAAERTGAIGDRQERASTQNDRPAEQDRSPAGEDRKPRIRNTDELIRHSEAASSAAEADRQKCEAEQRRQDLERERAAKEIQQLSKEIDGGGIGQGKGKGIHR